MLADQFNLLLLDLDGVVRLGPNVLPHAATAIARLRAAGKLVRFLTNDPRLARDEVAAELTRLGVGADVVEVVTSGWVTGAYLREQGVTAVHVVGSEGLTREMTTAGLRIDHDRPNAVVIGCDEHVGYDDIRTAAGLIRAGARFVATNDDATFPTPTGPWPATGAIVAAISTASGVRATVMGKPAPAMFETVMRTMAEGTRAVMVGDTPGTDILGAHRAGLPAILVGEIERAAPCGLVSTRLIPLPPTP